MKKVIYTHAISNQGGRLIEIPILGAILIMTGVLLGPKYTGAYILIFLGLVVFFLPNILHFVFAIRNRWRLHRTLSDLRRAGFAVRYVLIGSGAGNAVIFDTVAGNVVWFNIDGSTNGKLADIESVQLLTETWTSFGGPTGIVHTIRFTHNGKNTDFQQSGLWRARWKMRKLKKYLAPATVVMDA